MDFQLVTPTVGWVLTSNALLITKDRGVHWAKITPAGAIPAYNSGTDGIKGVAFTDAENGWVTIARSLTSSFSATVTLLHTSDGGLHWQARGSVTVALQYCMCGAKIDAVGSSDVWLDIDVGTKADGWGRDLLERSVDGGRTLRRVDLPTSGQLLFSDRLDGVVAGGSPSIFDHLPNAAGVAPFYATHDAGVTWEPLVLAPPPPSPSSGSPDPYTGYAVADGLAIAYVQSIVSASTVSVYAGDGGTWSQIDTITAGGLASLAVASRTTWFLADLADNATQPRLRVTDDAGKTWHTVSPVPDPMPGNGGVGLAFADPRDGWAYTTADFCLSFKSDCGTVDHLYATGDGGSTWQPVSVPGPPPTGS